MALVKVSTKNTLGFKHCMFPAIFCGLVALIVGNLIYDVLGDLLFVPAIVAYNLISVRRERTAPMLLVRRDPLLPRNDLECWCASTFAIWARFFDSVEGWPLICGGHKSKKFVASMRTALEDDWGIYNQEQGLKTIHEFTSRHTEFPDDPNAGWDLCRATQLLGMMYAVDWLTRDELDDEFSKAGLAIQRRFRSWDELCDSYLQGYAAWLIRIGREGAQAQIIERRWIFEQFSNYKYGPYAIPWNTNLSWRPGRPEENSKQETKKLLARYQPHMMP